MESKEKKYGKLKVKSSVYTTKNTGATFTLAFSINLFQNKIELGKYFKNLYSKESINNDAFIINREETRFLHFHIFPFTMATKTSHQKL